MKTIENPVVGKEIFKSLSIVSVLAIVTATVSCEKNNTPADDPENFVTLSISNVSDGHFTVDFKCGESTRTIEYAVCYAVNMKADSVAFASGELEGIVQTEPQADGTISVDFDFSDPLDFGPYTVYARAISGSGQVSPFVKQQVCALTTGVTVEYVSRATIEMKTSHHGDEAIIYWGLVSQAELDYSYNGELEPFLEKMSEDAQEYINYYDWETSDGLVRKFVIPSDDYYYKYGNIYAYFLATNGSSVTGMHAFEIPRYDTDPSIPLPGNLIVDEFVPVTELYPDGAIGYIMRTHITMGENTEFYTGVYTIESLISESMMQQYRNEYPDFYSGMSDEDIIKSLVLGTGPYVIGNRIPTFESGDNGMIVGYDSSYDYYDSFGETWILLACPVNGNWETGSLIIKEVKIPAKEEFPDPVPVETANSLTKIPYKSLPSWPAAQALTTQEITVEPNSTESQSR